MVTRRGEEKDRGESVKLMHANEPLTMGVAGRVRNKWHGLVWVAAVLPVAACGGRQNPKPKAP